MGCHGKAEKRDLIRVARSRGGRLFVDSGGTAPGRGAYVHRDRTCLDLALARGALSRALRAGAVGQGEATLRADMEGELSS